MLRFGARFDLPPFAGNAQPPAVGRVLTHIRLIYVVQYVKVGHRVLGTLLRPRFWPRFEAEIDFERDGTAARWGSSKVHAADGECGASVAGSESLGYRLGIARSVEIGF